MNDTGLIDKEDLGSTHTRAREVRGLGKLFFEMAGPPLAKVRIY